MSLANGTKLGTYEITEPLGKGGMGEVYRARDTKLGRDVAIKVLPEAFSEDPERLARFRREAQVLASLNHPNIATLHGLEEHDGIHYLIMELVEGETLAERLSNGALSIDEVRSIAKEIADGLEDAHEKGIVHRDLKPANLKITPEGRIKILDFGLAKAFVDDTDVADNSLSPTLTRDATRAGVILGTAAYMSPEQARGKPVDKRSDIFSFGSVLYEMLAGARAFDGEMLSDVLAAVIKTEPDWSRLPAEMAALVKRCMDKNPHERFRDIGDVRYELGRPASPSSTEGTPRPLWPMAIVAVAAFGLGIALFRPGDVPDARPLVRSTILPPEGERFTGGFGLALSPDGIQLAFTDDRALERRRLWIRRLDELDAVPLERTEGALFPFWSPDSRSLGFFADGALKIVSASGGTPRTVADAPNGRGGTWNDDGVILFASDPDGGLYRVDASGGDATPVTKPIGMSSRPTFLPDGRRFLFDAFVPVRAVFLGNIETGEVRELIPNAFGPSYAPPGWMLFLVRGGEGALFAQRFDAETLEFLGEPKSLVDGVWTPAGHASYSVSTAGQLVYEARRPTADLKIWMDREGTAQSSDPIPDDAHGWTYRISPSGKQLAVGGFGLGVVDLDRGVFQRLPTSGSGRIQLLPTWSPDGSRIAYESITRPDRYHEIRIASTQGNSDESLIIWDASDILDLDWSPDGEALLVAVSGPESDGNVQIRIVRVEDGAAETWLAADGNLSEGRFSPDGRWVAYRSDETGESEVYVRPFPGPGSPVRVSTAGGAHPSWRRDGRELFYIELAGNLMAVDIAASETLELSAPEALFQVGPPRFTVTRYDVTPDGQRFLVAPVVPTPLTLVQQWPQLLRE